MWGLILVALPWEPAAEPLPLLPLAVIAARDDCKRQPIEYRLGLRYMWVPSRVENADRFRQVLAGHLAHLSTESDLVHLLPVPGTKGRLLRVNVDDYGDKWRKSWERLAQADFWGHVTLEVKKQDWIDSVTRQYIKTTYERVTAVAPWIAEDPASGVAIAELVTMTQSQVPIIRADWFIWQTLIQNDRDPGYYDFLGIKDQKTFEDLVGFDLKLNQKSKRRELLEAVAESGVSRQPRRISAENTVGGKRYWRTFDNDKAVDKKNPLRVLDTQNFEFLATEAFGPLPNGIWAVGLWDNKGVIQKSAPDFVGYDKTTKDNNGRIEIGLGCIRCHYSDNGLKPIDTWARSLFRSPLILKSSDPNKARELRQQYARDLLGPLDEDRRSFANALKEATVCRDEKGKIILPGLSPATYAIELEREFLQYESPAGLDRVALEWGLKPELFQKKLEVYLKASESPGSKLPPLDTVLSTFLHPPEERKALGIDQWHELQPTVYATLRGVR